MTVDKFFAEMKNNQEFFNQRSFFFQLISAKKKFYYQQILKIKENLWRNNSKLQFLTRLWRIFNKHPKFEHVQKFTIKFLLVKFMSNPPTVETWQSSNDQPSSIKNFQRLFAVFKFTVSIFFKNQNFENKKFFVVVFVIVFDNFFFIQKFKIF